MSVRTDHPPRLALQRGALDRYPQLAAFHAKLGTRLLELPQQAGAGRVFAKCEFDNPSGTVKDRVACAMLWRLLQEEGGTDGLHVLEYSGGTLSVPLATLCEQLGVAITLVLSDGCDRSLINKLLARGAQVELVPKALGFYAVIERAQALSRENPSWRFLYQHTNVANVVIHETMTGREILEQLPVRRVDAWVASVGTGGTLLGVHRALRAVFPDVALYATTPAELPYGSTAPANGLPKFAGSGGFGLGRKQPFVEGADHQVRAHIEVSYPDALRAMRLARQELGFWIGSSSAANLQTARALASQLGPDSVVVTVFPCAGTPEERERAAAVQS
ncbi:MAG: pyridoxal-phosphate dependent enzyme [Myxococcales bacterium]|nr:pyridoxal-phosphate dependent enzyme [Myxococcales bacterium]